MRLDPTHPLVALAKPAVVKPRNQPKQAEPTRIQDFEPIGDTGGGFREDLTTARIDALLASSADCKNEMVLPYPPTANLYWRVCRGRVVKSKAAREYQRRIRNGLKPAPLSCPVVVDVELYRPRRIGDLDNALKVLLDALKGYAYVDDSQVVRILAWRFDDKANPRAVVNVRPAP